MKKVIIASILLGCCLGIFSALNFSNLSYIVAGRGCCSHHGGVCGCSSGRSKCCDGTLSPSCQCFREDIKPGLEI